MLARRCRSLTTNSDEGNPYTSGSDMPIDDNHLWFTYSTLGANAVLTLTMLRPHRVGPTLNWGGKRVTAGDSPTLPPRALNSAVQELYEL